MRRGTTPTITLESDFDFTGWYLYVTIVNGVKSITFENDSLTMKRDNGKSLISFTLTQEQTLSFKSGTMCEVEIRAYKDGAAVATDIESVSVDRILKDGVIGEKR